LTETPAFKRALEQAPPPRVPLAEVVREHPRKLLAGIFAVVCCYAIFYLATAFALGYGTTTLGYPREKFLGVQLFGILFMAAGTVVAGYLSDRFSPRAVLIGGCACAVPMGLSFAPLFGSGSLVLIALVLSLALWIMGFVYGPLGAWLPGLFPARVRYTGASMAFNIGGILGGALSPVIAQALATRGGLWPVGLYLSGAALTSLVALCSMPTTESE
jgi:MFS family permease